MLNLLFISDNPRAEQLKNELRPFLKVVIDVVTDFDRGMRDVFEKRPATVFIQDHIGTVSGESVARHIQMLLGSGAPTFILFHSGNARAQVVAGLFDYLVDLSLPKTALLKNFMVTLKPLLGNQWEKVFVPPPKKTDKTATPEKSPQGAQPLTPPLSEHGPPLYTPVNVSSVNDGTVELLLAQSKKAKKEEIEAQEKRFAGLFRDAASTVQADSLPEGKEEKSDLTQLKPTSAPPAEAFRIIRTTPQTVEPIPEELLFAFEENFRTRSFFTRRMYLIALVCILSAVGGWYLYSQKPQLVSLLKQRLLPSSAVKQTPLPVPPAVPVQKPVQPPEPPPRAAPALPSFIPLEGRDNAFAQKNPGWHRFVGKTFEFRVFTAPGRIEAIQVLSIHDAIPDSLITSVLHEFTGSPAYSILSRATKDGVRVESGTAGNKGEIKLYRKNGSVRAFVVSVI